MRLSIHPAITCPSIPPLNICSSIYLHIYCLFHPSFPHPPVHKYLPPIISSSASATIHTSAHQSILPSTIHSHPVNNSVCLSIRLQLFLCYHSSIHPSAHPSSSAHLFTIIWFFLFLPYQWLEFVKTLKGFLHEEDACLLQLGPKEKANRSGSLNMKVIQQVLVMCGIEPFILLKV